MQFDDSLSSHVIVPFRRYQSRPLSQMSVIRCSPAHFSWRRLKSPRIICSASVLSWRASLSSRSIPSPYYARGGLQTLWIVTTFASPVSLVIFIIRDPRSQPWSSKFQLILSNLLLIVKYILVGCSLVSLGNIRQYCQVIGLCVVAVYRFLYGSCIAIISYSRTFGCQMNNAITQSFDFLVLYCRIDKQGGLLIHYRVVCCLSVIVDLNKYCRVS